MRSPPPPAAFDFCFGAVCEWMQPHLAEIDSEIEPHRMAAGSAASVRHAALCSLLLAALHVWLIEAAFLLSLITTAGQRSRSGNFRTRARAHSHSSILEQLLIDALTHQWKYLRAADLQVGGCELCEARPTCAAPTLHSPLLFCSRCKLQIIVISGESADESEPFVGCWVVPRGKYTRLSLFPWSVQCG